ncbi:hypothetical protein K461DRAFT_316518 [Myriangium duriaei CBS 260.36]|uniref:Uncharacterized protein n=1 Tax=Myriangium duriaei CBS 260.36 TaxID=1168546 RepID=A0A9P4IQB6_9PEZI|nr:hypothetical protein K461DRAFT_316518 [Myriangium duriaei CBS 260.36]
MAKKTHLRSGQIWSYEGGWVIELLSAAAGSILIVGLVFALRPHDQHRLPHLGSLFGSNLSLNTLVAVISILSKAAFLYPVAECISQQKWMYFGVEPRPLNRLSTFDQASRGLWGGMTLIWETKARTPAAIGVLLMLYALTVDPLSQQLLSSEVRLVPSVESTANATARTGICHWWTEANSVEENDSTPSLDSQGAILSGLYADREAILDIAPVCSSGNCTFEPYYSLSVCPSFANVTSHLKKGVYSTGQWAHTSYNLSDENLLFTQSFQIHGLGNISMVSSSSLNGAYVDSIAFQNVLPQPLSDFFVIYRYAGDVPDPPPDDGDWPIQATEVLLEWCVQRFTTTVTNGIASTQRLDHIRLDSRLQGRPPLISDPLHSIYQIDQDTDIRLRYHFRKVFVGSWERTRQGVDNLGSNSALPLLQPLVMRMDSKHNDFVTFAGTRQRAFEIRMQNIATSLTNYMRSVQDNNITFTHNGVALEAALFIVISWKWIAVPILFAVLVWVFLLLTITAHRSGKLHKAAWKSSSLATLHALSPGVQQNKGGVDSHALMLDRDKKLKVCLQYVAGQGWRLIADSETEILLHTDP